MKLKIVLTVKEVDPAEGSPWWFYFRMKPILRFYCANGTVIIMY